MHQVVEIEKASVEAGHEQKKVLQEAAQLSAAEKWLGRSLVLIRWGVRVILIRTWASYLHHNFKHLAPSLPTLSACFIFFSLLLYACSLLYLRFARHALASLSFNRAFAVFNLSWAIVLLLIGLTSSSLGLVAAEDINTLSMFFYPHAIIAHLFIHLLTAPRRPSPLEPKEPPPPPKRSTICSLVVQIFLLLLWILYPIARVHDLNSPFVFTLFIPSTLVATVSFIVFFCSAIALVFFQHEEFPMLV